MERLTLNEFVEGFTEFFTKAQRSLKERFNKDPISTVDQMVHFTATRSAYVAQTSLYGYLKTRMGIKFRELFQDETYSKSIRASSQKLVVSCVDDLAVYLVCVVAETVDTDQETRRALALNVYERAINQVFEDLQDKSLAEEGIEANRIRVQNSELNNTEDGIAIFQKSISDLIRFAPVIDEFKELDREIVENSIRFRWIDIRQQVRKRIDPQGIYSNWTKLQSVG